MLFKSATLEGILAGKIELAFRRWTRPSVKNGTQLRTAIGIVSIDAVRPIDEANVTEREAKRAGFDSRADLFSSLRGEGTLYCVSLHHGGADPRVALRASAPRTRDELQDLVQRLTEMDRRLRGGASVRQILSLIDARPAQLAASLAKRCGMDTQPFKARVRKLKELGLTESLDVGYRLSARGQSVLAALVQAADSDD